MTVNRGILLGLILWGVGAQANVVGVDTQNFNPTTNGLDFVTVHSSQVLDPGIFNLGLFLNFAVNTLPQYETQSSRTDFSDVLLSSDVNFGVGLMRNWDIGFSFPAVIYQNVSSNIEGSRTEFSQIGFTEVRANTKYRFWRNSRETTGVAGVLSTNLNLIRNNPFIGENAGPTLNIELALDHRLASGWVLGFNTGRRFRQPGDAIEEVPVVPLPDQWLASVAASYMISRWDSKLIMELFSAIPARSQSESTDRELSTAEILVGMKKDLRHDIALHYGAGTRVLKGTASADWRVYTGLNWAMGPLWGRGSARQEDSVIVRRPISPPADEAKPWSQEVRSQPIDIGPQGDPFVGKPQAAQEAFVARDILFRFNSEELDPRFTPYLERMLTYLNQGDGYKSLVIEGHTDSVGSPQYNMALSLRRAQNVRNELIRLGGDPQRIRAVGKGQNEPVADNSSYQGRALNRRVEFKVQW